MAEVEKMYEELAERVAKLENDVASLADTDLSASRAPKMRKLKERS